ncbi:retrovirus-related Pol polyprotein from transposon 17.6 [Trichonephila clavipes]|nr:retrovirus-related Pol polyprotein from transposon 17.6 [Trichonephila clavipes]
MWASPDHTSKGNRYLITAICMSSKFPEAIPVFDISSVSVTDALLNIFSWMGFPVKYNGTRRYGLYSRKYTVRVGVWENLRTPETLVMEHWMEPEEGDLVTEYMFKLINRLKRCQEVAINKMEEMQVKRKTWKPDEDVDTTLLFSHSVAQGVCRNTYDGHRFCALARLISHTHSENS